VKLATLRLGTRTTAARVEEDAGEAVEISASDVGFLLAQDDWAQIAAAAAGTRHSLAELDFAPLVPRPGKIVCVGQNYKSTIAEQGLEPPAYPMLFAKFASALAGARDEIIMPADSSKVDWEVELAVVIGRLAFRASEEEALDAVAGYAVINDVSMRDWQFRTSQVLQGKTFDKATPLGPWLVTRDDPSVDEAGMRLTCEVDGEIVQDGSTSDLFFSVRTLVSYLSHVMSLRPADVIATGTPAGSGHWRHPPRYLEDGSVLVTRVAGLGECRNVCRRESPAGSGSNGTGLRI
jgi:acylpyruvate hydrolase